MSTFFLVLGMALALVIGWAGALAVATGKVTFPWLRRSVHRPRLWGVGSLLMAVALATVRVTSFPYFPLSMLAGLVLIGLAQFLGPREARRAE